MKIQFLDKDGWPVTLTRGRIIRNVLRLILHTKKIRFGEFVQNAKESGSTMHTAGAVTQGAEMDKKTTVLVLPGSRRCRIANGADIFHDNRREVYHEPPGSPPRVFMGIECVCS